MYAADEGNWRNDYPDEEESPHSSDSEQGDRKDYRNWQEDYSMIIYVCVHGCVVLLCFVV